MTTTAPAPLAQLLQHAAWARRLAAHLVRDGDADDLLQETWLASARAPAPPGAPPRRWLAAIMRNLARLGARSTARRGERERQVGEVLQGRASRPDEIAERIETQRLLAELVLALAPIHRDVVLLRFHDDLPPRQIAARLGIPPGTARSRLCEALRQLRQALEARQRDWRPALLVLAAGARKVWPPLVVVAAAAVGVIAVAPRAVTPPAAIHREKMAAPPRLAVTGPERLEVEREARAARAEAAARTQIPLGAGPLRGPTGAPVTVLELVDYQCPFTARAERALSEVLARYGDDVRFQVIHRPLPFHPQAELLARAALAAAEQGRFWSLHGLLLARPLVRWTPEALDLAAGTAGLDLQRFHADLDGPAVRAHAAVDEATAASIGAEGSPLFFVNGRLLQGADAPARMPAVIDEELARAEVLRARGVEGAALYNAAIAAGGAAMVPPPEPPRRPGGSPPYQQFLARGGACGPLLDAPEMLDLRTRKGEKRRALPWSLATAGGERYQHHLSGAEDPASITSATAAPEDFLGMQQTIVADPHRGRRVRFRAELQGHAERGWAGIWLRAIAADGRVLLMERAPAGGDAWHAASVELIVPTEASAVSFGYLLAGPGSLSVRALALEE
jgi:RNA polymerase sigma factor (sigma-70 family)